MSEKLLGSCGPCSLSYISRFAPRPLHRKHTIPSLYMGLRSGCSQSLPMLGKQRALNQMYVTSAYNDAALYPKHCRERRSMAGVPNARQRASLKSFLGTPEGKSSAATSAITILEWTSFNPDTIIYELQNSLDGAVVAQPGRALDLFGVKLKTELS
jgi:hypothetical protein